MRDGVAADGHRRWIIYPQIRYMGTGDIPYVFNYSPANAFWVFDLNNLWGLRPEIREVTVSQVLIKDQPQTFKYTVIIFNPE